jgi:hypothetical protein
VIWVLGQVVGMLFVSPVVLLGLLPQDVQKLVEPGIVEMIPCLLQILV